MFTQEEILDYIGPIKTIKLSDLYTPDVPEIEFPDWLPQEVKRCLQDHLDILNKEKKNPMRVYGDQYPNAIKFLDRVKNVFTDIRMKSFWNKLCEKPLQITEDFIILLLSIENKFDVIIHIKEKVEKNEIEKGKEVIEIIEKLIFALNVGQFNGFRQLSRVEGYDNILKMLTRFRNAFVEAYTELKELYKNKPFNLEYNLVTRKYKAENALQIAFIRSIYVFFMKNFSKPRYKDISLIIEVIFELVYIPDDIAKYIRPVKLKKEDSPSK